MKDKIFTEVNSNQIVGALIEDIADEYINAELASYEKIHDEIKLVATTPLKKILHEFTPYYAKSYDNERTFLRDHGKLVVLKGILNILMFAELLASAFLIFLYIYYWREWNFDYVKKIRPFTLYVIELMVLFVPIIVALKKKLSRSRFIPKKQIHEVAFNQFDQELTTRVSQCINRSLSQILYTNESVTVSVGSWRLIENSSSRIVESKSISEVCSFIETHETSAIGLCGPRGIGKSTALRKVAERIQEKNSCVIEVSIPVKYEADAIVRRLFDEFIRQAKNIDSPRFHGRKKWQSKIAGGELPLFIVGYMMVIYGTLSPNGNVSTLNDFLRLEFLYLPFGYITAILGIIAVYLAAFRMFRRSRSRKRKRNKTDQEYTLSNAEQQLRWSQEWSSGNEVVANPLGKFISLQKSSSIKRIERPFGLQDLSLVFRRTVTNFIRENEDTRVVFCIDELDKIEHSQGGLQIVNELKDLMHLRNSHFVLSVSDDALDSYALRGVPMRDAIDSTFDEILEIGRLDVSESWEVLRGRVPEFPPPLARFCYVWSLGNPRDLLRAARSCVKVMDDMVGDKRIPRAHLGNIAERVVYLDVSRALKRFLKREMKGLNKFQRSRLKNAMRCKNLWSICRELQKIERRLDGDSKSQWSAIIQYVNFAKRVVDQFAVSIKYEGWLRRVDSGELDRISTRLVENGLVDAFWGE